MKIIIVIVTVLILNLAAIAQDAGQKVAIDQSNFPELLNKLRPDQDSRLTNLVEWQIENNRKKNGIDGWRVEVFSGDLERARKVKQEILSLYPEEEVYIRFDAPDFKVRVGDCRTRNEALKLRKLILMKFPESFEVKDIINYPELASGGSDKKSE